MAKLPEGLLLIDGKMVPASNGATYPVISPWTGKEAASAANASIDDMRSAIGAARRAFDETSWSTDHDRRREILSRYAGLLKENRPRFELVAHTENGATPITYEGSQAKMPLGLLDGFVRMIDGYEWKTDIGIDGGNGAKKGFGAPSRRWIVREAAGVVGAITPWNAPLQVNIAKIFPALAAGCTVVLKSSPDTPLCGSLLGELAVEAGIPAGVLNVVHGEATALGEELVADRRVDLISFTGSTPVGKSIMRNCADTMKRVFLELGGKSAMIVLEDGDIDEAIMAASIGVQYQAGQGCATLTRMLVPRGKHDEIVGKLKQIFENAKYGDPAALDHVMAPLISKRQQDRVLEYIEIGKKDGATLVTGGAKPDNLEGYFVQPTLFANATNEMRIAREEIFGPVLTVIPHDGEDDAVRIANDSKFGLSGGVHTATQEKGMEIARKLRTGTVSINGGTFYGVDVPFGGFKESGIGREMGQQGFEEYLEIKAIAAPA